MGSAVEAASRGGTTPPSSQLVASSEERVWLAKHYRSPPLRNGKETQGMRTITRLFDSRAEAERAVETLVQQHGIDRDRVRIHGTEDATAGTEATRSGAPHGVLDSLRGRDQARYGEGLRRGGIMVSAEVSEEQARQAADTFSRHGAVDLDAREAQWRADGWPGGANAPGSSSTPDSLPAVNPDAAEHGWTGGGGAIGSTAATRDGPERQGVHSTYAGTSYVGARSTDEDITKPVNAGIASSPPVRPAGPAALAAAGAGASTSALRGSERDAALAASVGNEGPGTGAGPAAGSAAAGQAPLPGRATPGGNAPGTASPPAATARADATIPLVEEHLRVGKRDVSHGSVRVRSYVVETPVQDQVTLRQEHVQVDRHPVDRPLGGADRTGFQDRVVEATESAEEPVVDKEARVREEVVLRKTAEDRTETVRDTVRHTEVEVEDGRRPTAPPRATPPDRAPDR
jgi:uncharacterized protein (TIGR02271 family)